MTNPPLRVDGQAGATPGSEVPADALLGGYGRGVGWTYLGLVLTGGSTFFLAAWSVRRVGTAQYGLFALVTSLAGLLAVFDYALGLTVQRAGARAGRDPAAHGAEEHRAAVHAAHGAYMVLGMAGLVVAALAAAGAGLLGPGGTPYVVQTVALLGAAASLQLGTAALPAVAVASRRFALRSGATAAGVGVRVAVALVAVGRFGVAGLALAHLLGVVAERLVLAEVVPRRIPWFRLRPSAPGRGALQGVAAYAGPLLLISMSGQLFAVSDLVAVGVLVGASAVGVYQVAGLLPLYLAAVLVVGYNVAFPALAASDDPADQERATALLTRVFAYVGGTGLAVVALLRGDVVEVLLGSRNELAEDVLLALCAMSVANLLVHGLAALLIARGRQLLMARAVAVELPVNIVLTVALVVRFGAVGAAVATLVTTVLMDFAILPFISRGEFALGALGTTVRDGVAPAAAGALVALAASQIADLAAPPGLRLALGAVVAGALGLAVGLVLLGQSGRAAVRRAVAPDLVAT